MSDSFAALDRMRSTLEEGLSLLDRGAMDDPNVVEALGRVAEQVVQGPDPAELRKNVAPADLDRFDDQLEELTRLNAVLSRAVALDRDQLEERLGAVRSSRRDLAYYGENASDSGARCDMSA